MLCQLWMFDSIAIIPLFLLPLFFLWNIYKARLYVLYLRLYRSYLEFYEVYEVIVLQTPFKQDDPDHPETMFFTETVNPIEISDSEIRFFGPGRKLRM